MQLNETWYNLCAKWHRRGQNLEQVVSWTKIDFDLQAYCTDFGSRFPVSEIYLFGSRRHQTGSLRSDIDLLVIPADNIRPSDLRAEVTNRCKALDFFILERGTARSVVNDSYISALDNEAIISRCDAVRVWSAGSGFEEGAKVFANQSFAEHVDFRQTVMPNIVIQMSYSDLQRSLGQRGLPTDPVVGETEPEIADRLLRVAREAASFRLRDFPGSGNARKSFLISPSSEYDYQDIFWVCAKPWVSSILREVTEVVIDGQKKKSDFSVASSRFIIEMKYAADKNDKREIQKTLEGLKHFYTHNANVQFLLFIIYARKEADIDAGAWERMFSDRTSHAQTMVRVIEV